MSRIHFTLYRYGVAHNFFEKIRKNNVVSEPFLLIPKKIRAIIIMRIYVKKLIVLSPKNIFLGHLTI